MMKPWELYPRLINDTYRTIADDGKRREIHFRYVLKILVLILCITAGVSFIESRNWTKSVFLLIFAFSYFLDYWIVYFGKNKGVQVVSILLIVKAMAMYLYVLITGFGNGFSITWILIFPTAVIILMGRKVGMIASVIVLLQLIFFFWTPFGNSLLLYPYTSIFRSRLPLVFLILLLLTLFSETLRVITVQQLRKSKQRMESVYKQQYSTMSERIEEARRTRHDLRHHFVMINQYLEDGKIEEAQAYIRDYYQSLPFEESLNYCQHYETNALMTYCAQRAKLFHIEKEIHVSYPEQMPFPNDDLTVVFGNLLENALEASIQGMEQGSNFVPHIWVTGSFDGTVLLFAVRNKAIAKAVRDAGGYLSSKHEGNGIGIASVQGVIEKYDGTIFIEEENGEFSVRLTMCPQIM